MSGDADLAAVDVRSGVNGDGEGFCTVVASSASGRLLVGQLTPDEVRALALSWLEAAEAAEHDAAVLRCIRRLELPRRARRRNRHRAPRVARVSGPPARIAPGSAPADAAGAAVVAAGARSWVLLAWDGDTGDPAPWGWP